MDQDRFEAEVVALAAEGVKLTVANVVARTGLPPRLIEERLDGMVATHRLDSEIDEAHGCVFYKVRGLDPEAARSRLAVLEREIALEASRGQIVARPVGPVAITPHREKNTVLGVVLALCFGPLGLLYAGPAEEVAAYFVAWLVMMVLGGVPLLGTLAQMIALILWVGSAALQIVYVARYNANGQRTGLIYRPRGGLGGQARGARLLRR